MEAIEGYSYQTWIAHPDVIFNSYTPDVLPGLAARDIVKHLDGFENFELPMEYYNDESDTLTTMNYDELVAMIENIIRHYFGLEPSRE